MANNTKAMTIFHFQMSKNTWAILLNIGIFGEEKEGKEETAGE